jgi:NADPH-dependent glutamate synthase beta subunit-like oxidoreductase
MESAKQRRTGNYDNQENGSRTCFPVVIIGAGAGGLAMGCQLKRKLKFNNFKIYERQSGIGGELPVDVLTDY